MPNKYLSSCVYLLYCAAWSMSCDITICTHSANECNSTHNASSKAAKHHSVAKVFIAALVFPCCKAVSISI